MDLNRRAFICIAAATLVPPDLAVAQVQRETPVDTDLVEGVLNAGKWSATADDNGGGEQLPEEFVKSIVQMYEAQKSQPSQKAVDGVGIMVLALSVAEWGVTWTRKPPADPANTEWRGPTDITQGKHLMSYALGGIGIPHLDVDGAQRFLSEVGTRYPKAATDVAPFTNRRQTFRYDRVRATGGPCAPHTGDTVIMTDLDGKPFEHNAMTFGGPKYCARFNPGSRLDAKQWQVLRHWCRVGLRDKAMQSWIIQDWLDHVWMPTYRRVMIRKVPGSLQEAFVLARILNSSNGAMKKALRAAGETRNAANRIAAELGDYGHKDGTHFSRIGLMQRPGVVYEQFS